MNDIPLIQARDICRRYGKRPALDHISFSLQRGEVAVFLGPNGAGKSTLMQIVCGVLAPSSGTVSIAGHDIVDGALQARRHLGYLPEQPPLYTDVTVEEYLRYCARLRAVPEDHIEDSIANAVRLCGLEDSRRRLINNLSKGYRQRVGIAQAILHQPDVIVLDEPSAGVDPNQMIEIRRLIRELGERHSVILSTHILTEAQSVGDRVLIMNAGRLVLDETMSTVGKDLELAYLELTGDRQATRAAAS